MNLLTSAQLASLSPWLIVIVFIALCIIVFIGFLGSRKSLQQYAKRVTIFDATSEIELFKLLLDLYGNKYYIFPQMNYSHVLEPIKTQEWKEQMRLRSRIDTKSADFVLCDTELLGPVLVIELDGDAHKFRRHKERDDFLGELMKSTNLPICYLSSHNLTKEYVHTEVQKALGNG